MPTAAKITGATHSNAHLLFSDNDCIINVLVVLNSRYVIPPRHDSTYTLVSIIPNLQLGIVLSPWQLRP